MKTKTKVQRLQKKIAKCEKELREIQDECAHDVEIRYKPRMDTGNLYESNEYWYEFECMECGKRWTTPQDCISNLFIRSHKNARTR